MWQPVPVNGRTSCGCAFAALPVVTAPEETVAVPAETEPVELRVALETVALETVAPETEVVLAAAAPADPISAHSTAATSIRSAGRPLCRGRALRSLIAPRIMRPFATLCKALPPAEQGGRQSHSIRKGTWTLATAPGASTDRPVPASVTAP